VAKLRMEILLRQMFDSGASDLLLTVGRPPQLRIHGPFGSDSLHVEDPIEYIHAHGRSVIDQREIGEDAMSFSDALCSVFRQSPDVIMVGVISQQLILTQDESARVLAPEVMNVDNAIRNLMREKQVQ
jgi:Tfp pilus assembly pilus retraction ATPase PilT